MGARVIRHKDYGSSQSSTELGNITSKMFLINQVEIVGEINEDEIFRVVNKAFNLSSKILFDSSEEPEQSIEDICSFSYWMNASNLRFLLGGKIGGTYTGNIFSSFGKELFGYENRIESFTADGLKFLKRFSSDEIISKNVNYYFDRQNNANTISDLRICLEELAISKISSTDSKRFNFLNAERTVVPIDVKKPSLSMNDGNIKEYIKQLFCQMITTSCPYGILTDGIECSILIELVKVEKDSSGNRTLTVRTKKVSSDEVLKNLSHLKYLSLCMHWQKFLKLNI